MLLAHIFQSGDFSAVHRKVHQWVKLGVFSSIIGQGQKFFSSPMFRYYKNEFLLNTKRLDESLT